MNDENAEEKDKDKEHKEHVCIDNAPCPWKQWGNSVLAINAKYWNCSYCGHLIKDGKPFQVMRINGTNTPFFFDTEHCMIMQIKKLEAGHMDKTE